jgi:hypothetical protein
VVSKMPFFFSSHVEWWAFIIKANVKHLTELFWPKTESIFLLA